jgi:hypothetical protein
MPLLRLNDEQVSHFAKVPETAMDVTWLPDPFSSRWRSRGANIGSITSIMVSTA